MKNMSIRINRIHKDTRDHKPVILGVDSPVISTIGLFKNQPFSLRFRRFSRKKDPWKEWGRYPTVLARLMGSVQVKLCPQAPTWLKGELGRLVPETSKTK